MCNGRHGVAAGVQSILLVKCPSAQDGRGHAGTCIPGELGRFRSLFCASDGAIVDGEDKERVARTHNVAGAQFATAAKYNYVLVQPKP